MENSEELLSKLDENIKIGEKLMLDLEPVQDIDGVMKLHRRIRMDVQFFYKLKKSKKVKLEHLICSNLRQLGAMVECARRPTVSAVCKIFHIDNNNKLLIDIVSEQGSKWTKVIARNPKSLSALSSGNASYGARSILDQAEDYLACAKLYPCLYQPPKVVFEFTSGIEESLANKLSAIGIIVEGEVLPNSDLDDKDDSWASEEDESQLEIDCHSTLNISECIKDNPGIDTLNLDVTTMMAYVSNMTNGNCNYIFEQNVLTVQSEWESKRPVKPLLVKLFEGKTLVCCRTAWDNFENIVNTLGGPQEKDRAAKLKEKLVIYADDYEGENDNGRQNLKVRGHVRERSKIIFNFGHRIKALTVSANEGFLRAAYQQGVTYAAYIHESRALTEGKEATAKLKTTM